VAQPPEGDLGLLDEEGMRRGRFEARRGTGGPVDVRRRPVTAAHRVGAVVAGLQPGAAAIEPVTPRW
jgi:hypothetical protein